MPDQLEWRCGTCYRGPTRDDLFDGGWTLGDDGDVYCPRCSAPASQNERLRVFGVWEDDWEDNTLWAVYSKREDAEAHAAVLSSLSHAAVSVREHEILGSFVGEAAARKDYDS